jgi:formate-dependent phosphoribosylglycinamide formyltransferase (GAR transformylase)
MVDGTSASLSEFQMQARRFLGVGAVNADLSGRSDSSVVVANRLQLRLYVDKGKR